MFQRGREVTSWNSGGEAAAQRKWAYGCACWSCVWPWRGGGGLLPEVAVACGGVTAGGAHTAPCQVEPHTTGARAKRRRLRWLQDVHSYLTCRPSPGSQGPGHLMEGPGSLLDQASGHTRTPTPAKFSLHVWKVKPGVIVSLLI